MSQDSLAPTVVYKPVPGFPKYRVGDDGSVWHEKKGVWRKRCPSKNDRGYFVIQLRRDGKYFNKKVNQLVLVSHVGPCPPGMESAHENGKPGDNRLSNLSWKTKKENAADRVRHGTAPIGEKNESSKLTDDQVREIRKIYNTTKKTELMKRFGITRNGLWLIHKRLRWAHLE